MTQKIKSILIKRGSEEVEEYWIGDFGVSEIRLTQKFIDGDPYDHYEVVGDSGNLLHSIRAIHVARISYTPTPEEK